MKSIPSAYFVGPISVEAKVCAAFPFCIDFQAPEARFAWLEETSAVDEPKALFKSFQTTTGPIGTRGRKATKKRSMRKGALRKANAGHRPKICLT